MKFDLNVHILEEVTNILISEYIVNPISREIYELIGYKRQSTNNSIIKGLWYNFVIHDLPTKNNISFWGLQLNKIRLYDFVQGKLLYLDNRDKNIFPDFNDFVINISKYESLTKLSRIDVTLKSFAEIGKKSFLYLHNIEKIQILIKGNKAKKQLKKDQKELIVERSNLKKINKQLLDARKSGFYTEIYKQVNVQRRKEVGVDIALESIINELGSTNIHVNRLLKDHNNDIKYVIKYLHNTYYKSPYKDISK